MLKHYSHIRMEAKRRALEAILAKPDQNATGRAVSAASKETSTGSAAESRDGRKSRDGD
jgi:hypothetical protein